VFGIVAGLVIAWPGPGATQTQGERVRFVAFAINMGPGAARTSSTVDINIDRWSSEAERKALVTAFAEKGEDALLRELTKTKSVGNIRLPTSVGYTLHFARQVPLPDGGRRVLIATDRRIDFWEARNQPRSMDYRFTLIELRLNRNGEGEGKLALATKIAFNKKENVIELENYGDEPVRLNQVRTEKRD
jgi:hypothetical protein